MHAHLVIHSPLTTSTVSPNRPKNPPISLPCLIFHFLYSAWPTTFSGSCTSEHIADIAWHDDGVMGVSGVPGVEPDDGGDDKPVLWRERRKRDRGLGTVLLLPLDDENEPRGVFPP
jgi:hypothetical protein